MNPLTDKLINRKYEWTYITGMTGSVVFTEDKANWKFPEFITFVYDALNDKAVF